MVDVVQWNRKYNWASCGGCCGGVAARLLSTSEHVDDGVFDERTEDEHKTHRHPDVNCLGKGHGWHSAHVYRALSGDRQHGENTERDARRH